MALKVEKCKVMEITNRRTTIRFEYCFKLHKFGVGGLIQILESANRHIAKTLQPRPLEF